MISTPGGSRVLRSVFVQRLLVQCALFFTPAHLTQRSSWRARVLSCRVLTNLLKFMDCVRFKNEGRRSVLE